MAKTQDKDQIRNLTNRVHLGGILAELDKSSIKEGKGTDGVPYISVKGAVQCSPNDAAYTAYFSIFCKATTAKGTENKSYAKIKKWVKTAVPMTKDKENATFVDMMGSLTSNNYVSADGTFKETFVYNINFINDFKEYCFDLDIEGYVNGIEDMKDDNDEETGEKRIGLTSKDFFNNALIFDKKNKMNLLIADKETAESFDDVNYEAGKTITISCMRDKKEAETKVKKSGFGRQPVTSGPATMYWKIVGGDEALDEDDEKSLTKAQIKTLTSQYNENNNAIIEKGYQGGKKDSNSSESRKGFNKRNSDSEDDEDSNGFKEVEEDDDMPF